MLAVVVLCLCSIMNTHTRASKVFCDSEDIFKREIWFLKTLQRNICVRNLQINRGKGKSLAPPLLSQCFGKHNTPKLYCLEEKHPLVGSHWGPGEDPILQCWKLSALSTTSSNIISQLSYTQCGSLLGEWLMYALPP